MVVLGLIISIVIYAAPPGSAYNPGETLSPSCAPGDVNCTVLAPTVSTRLINTTSPLSGGGNLTADRTFSIAGLTATGTPNYFLGVNSTGLNWEYKQLLGTTNQIILTNAGASSTLSLPQSIATSSSPSFAELTLSNLTAGSVPFVGAGGLLSQNNAKFFWDNTNARLGVGTTTPAHNLSIVGSSLSGPATLSVTATPSATGGSNRAHFYLNNASSTGWALGEYGDNNDLFTIATSISGTITAHQFAITSAGNVGIGTIDPSAQKLVVAGNVRVGTGTTGCVQDADGTLLAGTCSSDIRLKQNITPFFPVLDRLVKLSPVTYNWRSDEFPDRQLGTSIQTGLIAQDVEAQFPELVVEDDKGFKQITFQYLPFYILKGIQELNSNVEFLTSMITTTTIEESPSFISRFFTDIFTRITAWFADTANGIGDFFAGRVHTKELCVGDTCVNEEQLKTILQNTGASEAVNQQSSRVFNTTLPSATTSTTELTNQPQATMTNITTATSTPQE